MFDGYTDKKDADFIEERRVRTAETRQDTSAVVRVTPAEGPSLGLSLIHISARRRPAGDRVQ